MAKFKRYDTYSLNEAKKDENGYYHDSAIVGRVGLLTYYNADGTKRIEYRPPKTNQYCSCNCCEIRQLSFCQGSR